MKQIRTLDLVILALIIGVAFYVAVSFVQINANLRVAAIVNQTNANTQAIQQIVQVLNGGAQRPTQTATPAQPQAEPKTDKK